MQSLPTHTESDSVVVSGASSANASIALLRAVLSGQSYDAAALAIGISRTAVEQRVKKLAWRLVREVGIAGVSEGSVGSIQRLREHRNDVFAALDRFERVSPLENEVRPPHDPDHVFSDLEIAAAAQSLQVRSPRPWHDLALFYVLLATGARPTEVAALRVCDYLAADGTVRHCSQMPAAASMNGRARPLYFASSRLVEALDHYLEERRRRGQGSVDSSSFRGLDPASRLFLSYAGEPYRVSEQSGSGRGRRHGGRLGRSCRPIHDAYRKLFRMAELQGTTPFAMRRTLVARLYGRGADEEQVGLVLGIRDRGAVRELLPRRKREIAELVEELV